MLIRPIWQRARPTAARISPAEPLSSTVASCRSARRACRSWTGASSARTRPTTWPMSRRTVIELARAAAMSVEERTVGASELRDADEVFITSTAGGVMPITRIDGAPVGQGRPGPVTQALRRRYWEAHREPEWSEPVAYGERHVAPA